MSRVQIIAVNETHGTDYCVYAGDRLIRVCPSRGMADEIAAGF